MIDREAITIGREPFDTFYADAKPLLEAHWREVTHFPDIPLNPDLVRYRTMDEAGILHIFTIRGHATNKLLGYAVFFVLRALHYADSIWALEDVIYIDPEMRGGVLGKTLIEYTERVLREIGVEVVVHHQKNRHPQLGRLLGHMGYEAFETNWIKRLIKPGGE